MASPPVHPVDVFLILHDGPSVLLARRQNTGYHDGLWNLPSGKLEYDEDAPSGMIREAREEIGIVLSPSSLRLAVTVHHEGRIGLFFAAPFEPASQGQPVNAEPHKCSSIGWFPAAALPVEMSDYSEVGIRGFRDGTPFLLSGWS
jgi:8-oxo-dGTP diphosphatase